MAHRTQGIRDHVRNRSQPNIDNEAISQQLENLVKPCVYNQLADYRSLGMRERILSLPLMLAAVLTLVWQQVPSARELNRMLARENLLWARVTKVSQQALSQRLLSFPASMFEKVLDDLLVPLNQKWQQRQKRKSPLGIVQAKKHFERIWIADASTLEALFRELKSLEDKPLGQLGGRICAVVDLQTRYPIKTWFHERPYAHESNFERERRCFASSLSKLRCCASTVGICSLSKLVVTRSRILEAVAHGGNPQDRAASLLEL